MSLKRRCPCLGHCFAEAFSNLQQNIYEEIFLLVKEGNFSFTESYNFPVGLRKWFVQRTIKHITPEEEE